jgi:hypothetical protein
VRDTPGGARAHYDDARQFLANAREAFAKRRYKAAVSAACISGIRSADTICVAILGRHSASPNHAHSANLLRQAAPSGQQAAPIFELLAAGKNPAQYQTQAVDRAQAQERIDQADALLRLARQALATLGGTVSTKAPPKKAGKPAKRSGSPPHKRT